MKIQLNHKWPLYCTSDLHFHHANILKFQNNRSSKFPTIEEMNEGLVKLWNEKVEKNSNVIIAGDFSFGTPEQTVDIFRQLNGVKYLTMGNHDSANKLQFCDFQVVGDMFQFKYNGKSFFVSHFAHKVWDKSHYGCYHVYGHSHGSLEDDPNALSMDVGIDCHPTMQPFSYDEIRAHMKTKTFVPIDHHTRETT